MKQATQRHYRAFYARKYRDGIVKAFNKWMDDYINHPEKYEAEFKTVMQHLKECKGKEPSYGEGALAMLIQHGAGPKK